MVGSIIQGAAQIGSNIINASGLELNRKIAYSNANMQQKAGLLGLLQQFATWDREDNAVQRRVADLRRAGLSPVLAAGQPAQAGPAMRIDATQNKFQFPMNAFNIEGIGALINNSMLTKSQIEKNDAEIDRTKTLTMLDLLNNPHKIKLMNAKQYVLYQDLVTKQLQNMIYKMTGIAPTGASILGAHGRDAAAWMNAAATQAKQAWKDLSK